MHFAQQHRGLHIAARQLAQAGMGGFQKGRQQRPRLRGADPAQHMVEPLDIEYRRFNARVALQRPEPAAHRWPGSLPGYPAREHLPQAMRGYRFCQHVIHAGIQTTLALGADDCRAQCDDGHPAAAHLFAQANCAGQFQPVHDRHVQVRKDQVVTRTAPFGQCRGAIIDYVHIATQPGELQAEYRLVRSVVFGHQQTRTVLR